MPIELIDKIKPKNGDFALVDAEDVDIGDGLRLKDVTEAPTIKLTSNTYVFDVKDTQQIISLEVSRNPFGKTLVYLEQKQEQEQDTSYRVVSQVSTTGGVISFNLASLKLKRDNYYYYRVRAVNPFDRSSVTEDIEVSIISMNFTVDSVPGNLVAYNASNKLELEFKFDSVPELPNTPDYTAQFVVNGVATAVEVGDTECTVTLTVENDYKGTLDLTYYLQYVNGSEVLLQTPSNVSSTYVLPQGTADFRISIPNQLSSSDYWKINVTPIYDVSLGNVTAAFYIKRGESLLDSKEISFDSSDLFDSHSISFSPLSEILDDSTVTVDVTINNSEGNSIQDVDQFNIHVIPRDLGLVMYYDATDSEITDTEWPNQIEGTPYTLQIVNAVGNIQAASKEEVVLTGDTYAEVTMPSLDTSSDQFKGFTLETYIKSDFLGNLSASALNIDNILKINYDEVVFNYGGVVCTTDLFSSTYHHVAVVCDLTESEQELDTIEQLQTFNNMPNLKIYVDGVLSAATSISDLKMISQLQTMYLNKYNGAVSSGKNQTYVKYIKFYKTPLTSADVYTNYVQALSEADGTTVSDRNNLNNMLEFWFVRDVEHTGSDAVLKGPTTFDELHRITQKEADSSNRGSKTSWVNCKIYYKLPQAESILKTDYDARILLQGTSTLAYPVKNYRFAPYKEIKDEENLSEEDSYEPCETVPPGAPDVWKSDVLFTLKCDYMESSHRNNTPTACFYHDKLLPKVIEALHPRDSVKNYESPALNKGFRDSIDGFPCIVYYVDNPSNVDAGNLRDQSIFAGSYMFNIDKEGKQLGFTIDDNTEMVSYEGGTNTNIGAAAFQTQDLYQTVTGNILTSQDYFEESIEARYASMGDKSADYLQRFSDCVTFLNDSKNPLFNSSITPESEEYKTYQSDFKAQFSYEYCMAYYLQMMLFAQVDSAGKNAMFDYWGQNGKIYVRPYDMDTQVGLSNFGDDDIPVSAIYHDLLAPDTTKYHDGSAIISVSSDKKSLSYTLGATTIMYDQTPDDALIYEHVDSETNKSSRIVFNRDIESENKYYITIEDHSTDSKGVYYNVSCELVEGNVYQFEIHNVLHSSLADRLSWSTNQSVLWKTFATLFSDDIKNVYTKLRNDVESMFTADNINEYIKRMSVDKIGETIYNADAARRYLNYKVGTSYKTDYYKNIRGNRNVRYYKYLKERIKFLDSYFNISGSTDANFRNGTTNLISNTLSTKFDITPKMYSPSYIRVNVDQRKPRVELLESDSTIMSIATQGAQKKNMSITGFGNCYELQGIKGSDPSTLELSAIPDIIKLDLSGCSKLTGNYTISDKRYLTELNLSNVQNDSLGITISNVPNLHTIVATNSKLSYLTLPSNLESVEQLNLNGTVLKQFSISNNSKLTLDTTLNLKKDSLQELSIDNCSNIAVNKTIVFDGYDYTDLKTLTFRNNSVEKLEIKNFTTEPLILDFGTVDEAALTKLTIHNCVLSDGSTLDLSHFTSLETLVISDVSSACNVKLPESLRAIQLHTVSFNSVTTKDTFEDKTYDFGDIKLNNTLVAAQGWDNYVISDTPVQTIKNLKLENSSQSISLQYAFGNNAYLEKFVNSTIKADITTIANIFYSCSSLTAIPTMTDSTYSNCTSCNSAFSGCKNLDPEPPLTLLEKISDDRGTEAIECTGYMYTVGSKTTKTYKLDLDILPKNCSKLTLAFSGSPVTEILVGVNSTIHQVSLLDEVFSSCSKLSTIPQNFLDYFTFNENKSCSVRYLFHQCTSLIITAPITSKTTLDNIENASGMFMGCTKIDKWNNVNIISKLSDARDLSAMYCNCSKLNPSLEAGMFNNSNLISIESIFASTALEINNTIKTPMPNIFGSNCTSLERASGMFAFTKLNNVIIPNDLFQQCTNITCLGITYAYSKYLWNNYRLLIPGMFTGVSGSLTVDLVKLLEPLQSLENISGMFASIKAYDSDNRSCFNTHISQSKDATFLFEEFGSLELVVDNTSGSLPTTITDESFLFAYTSTVFAANATIDRYISANVQNVAGMFMYSDLVLPLKSLKSFTSIYSADYMFCGCSNLSGSIPEDMFSENVESARYMFAECTGLDQLSLTTFQGAKSLKYLTGCFAKSGLTSLPEAKYVLDVTYSSDEPKHVCTVSGGGGLFRDCVNLEDIEYCFGGCDKLAEIIPSTLFNTSSNDTLFSNLTNIKSLFRGCTHIGSYFDTTQKKYTALKPRTLTDIFEFNTDNDAFYPDNYEFDTTLTINQNLNDVFSLPWKVSESNTGKYLISLDEISDKYVIPENWLSKCPNISSLDHVFTSVGSWVFEYEEDQNKNEDILRTLKNNRIPSNFTEPFDSYVTSCKYCFANVPIINSTVLTNAFLKDPRNLESIEGCFYRSYLGGIDGCFTSPEYYGNKLDNISYAFYIKSPIDSKISKEEQLPGFSRKPVKYFRKPTFATYVYNQYSVDDNFYLAYVLQGYTFNTGPIDSLAKQLEFELTVNPEKTLIKVPT